MWTVVISFGPEKRRRYQPEPRLAAFERAEKAVAQYGGVYVRYDDARERITVYVPTSPEGAANLKHYFGTLPCCSPVQ
jgi:hypothetical protein